MRDAGERDAGGATIDGGPLRDAGGDDAGVVDASSGDADGDTDAATPDDASTPDGGPDAGDSTCTRLYGAATDFMLCDETPTACTFAVRLAKSTCRALCASFGGTCLDAFDNSSTTPCVILDPGDDCDTERFSEICVCDVP